MIVPLLTRSGEIVGSTLIDDDDLHLVEGVAWRLHRNTGYVRAENQQNRHSVCGRSRHRGVSWHSRDRLWVAHATFNGRTVTVGRFADEDQAGAAAAAYRAKHMPFSAEFVDERETQEV